MVKYKKKSIYNSKLYEKAGRRADFSIISNSPLVAMTNTVLNTPLLGGMNPMRFEPTKLLRPKL